MLTRDKNKDTVTILYDNYSNIAAANKNNKKIYCQRNTDDFNLSDLQSWVIH